MKIGIVVVVYAEYPTVLFDSLKSHYEHQITWFIHCHSSRADIENGLVNFCVDHQVNLTLHKRNRGLAKSWNDGILDSYRAGMDLTLVVNDDIAFLDNGLSKWVSHLNGYYNFGLGFVHGREIAGSNAGEVVHQGFACFAFGPAAYTRLGAFDENFFPAYSEDTDYIKRAYLEGLPENVDRRVLVDHARNKTTRVASEIRNSINPVKTKNTELFREKWGGDFESTTYDLAWNKFPLKINWDRRRAPYGLPFDCVELYELEPERRQILSWLEVDKRMDLSEESASPISAEEKAAHAVIVTTYKALLSREPEASAISFYAKKLVAGTYSIDDICDIVRSSKEHLNILGRTTYNGF